MANNYYTALHFHPEVSRDLTNINECTLNIFENMRNIILSKETKAQRH